MIDLNEYSNISNVLKRIAEMQDISRAGDEDNLDKVIKKYAQNDEELSIEELELATAAAKPPEIPGYLKKNKNI